jgi:hypothetical protein
MTNELPHEECWFCKNDTFHIVWTTKGYHMICTRCGKDLLFDKKD